MIENQNNSATKNQQKLDDMRYFHVFSNNLKNKK
jgi:hypothetical protein